MCAARTLGSEEHGLYAAEFDDLHDSAEIGRLFERLQQTHKKPSDLGAHRWCDTSAVCVRACALSKEGGSDAYKPS